ncbi:putative glycosyl hydrolase [Thermanaerovibrio velox DSM 12556]|uniref:Putative glycosyl hydrolase n=1 Tax=Thermanaerovibrio velox DSM 12556 TaxID=926567 RepID=H0UPV7_9BACT|nr:glycosyl hydrolase family 18 protein [Thermanaerovibrio velox]EHM10666.1 putative glycosyl hydrolase [Thermanaerovibrio velox DSM 12556]
MRIFGGFGRVLRMAGGLVAALPFLIFGIWVGPGAADDQVPLYLNAVGDRPVMAGTAIRRGESLLVPLGALRRLGADVAFDGGSKLVVMELRRGNPMVSFDVPLEGLRLTARGNPVSGDVFMDIRGFEPVLGIAMAAVDDGVMLYRLNSLGELKDLPSPLNSPLEHPFSLVWDPLYRTDPHLDPSFPSVSVVSPSWFKVRPDGEVEFTGRLSYVEGAHRLGVRVWPLVHNGFDPGATKAFLNDPTAVNRAVGRIVAYCSLLGLDGINLDFENMDPADKDAYSAFVRAVAERLRPLGLKTSVDVTVESTSAFWSRCYDRRALGEAADYVMVMTYDEHWGKSPVAGSVASLPWVQRGLEGLLRSVPGDKLLLGLPFYTRVWEESPSGGGVKVRSKALSMGTAESKVQENQAQVRWLEEAGQFYAEYLRDGKRYRIWLEEERSLGLKASLVPRYGLAGVAAWRRGFERPEVWGAIHNSMGAAAVRGGMSTIQ